MNYVAQFGFPVDYVGPEYHAFFRDKDLVPNAHARGFKVAPWPVGADSRDDLRQLFRLDPELVVTNKPEVAVSILTGWASGTNHPKRVDSPLFWEHNSPVSNSFM